ncbi:MAG: hypothetical protein IT245_08505, partial [Bacteroidia bacterium]|nr:hypothetical protein [Bacteroidia bacterium]
GGLLISQGLSLSIEYKINENYTLISGFNYTNYRAGLGITKQLEKIRIQIALSYHQFLGTGNANAIQYYF